MGELPVHLKSLKNRTCHVDECGSISDHEVIGPDLVWLGDACDEHAGEALRRAARGIRLHEMPKAAIASGD